MEAAAAGGVQTSVRFPRLISTSCSLFCTHDAWLLSDDDVDPVAPDPPPVLLPRQLVRVAHFAGPSPFLQAHLILPGMSVSAVVVRSAQSCSHCGCGGQVQG